MLKEFGFTLYELVITISICAILSYIAAPHIKHLLIQNEVNHLKRIITIHIQKAKTDAQIHHKNVMLCPSTDMQTCDTDWNQGFIGFIDTNRNGQRNPTEPLLYTILLKPKYGTLDWRGARGVNHLTFRGDTGLPRGSNGSFFYCMHTATTHTRIFLSNMGHTRFEKISDC